MTDGFTISNAFFSNALTFADKFRFPTVPDCVSKDRGLPAMLAVYAARPFGLDRVFSRGLHHLQTAISIPGFNSGTLIQWNANNRLCTLGMPLDTRLQR